MSIEFKLTTNVESWPGKVHHPNLFVWYTDLQSCHGCLRLQVPPPWRVCPAMAPAAHSQLSRPQYSSAHTQNHHNQSFRPTVLVYLHNRSEKYLSDLIWMCAPDLTIFWRGNESWCSLTVCVDLDLSLDPSQKSLTFRIENLSSVHRT